MCVDIFVNLTFKYVQYTRGGECLFSKYRADTKNNTCRKKCNMRSIITQLVRFGAGEFHAVLRQE